MSKPNVGSMSMLEQLSKASSSWETLVAGLLPKSCLLLLDVVSTYTNKAINAPTEAERLEHLAVCRKYIDEIQDKLKTIKPT